LIRKAEKLYAAIDQGYILQVGMVKHSYSYNRKEKGNLEEGKKVPLIMNFRNRLAGGNLFVETTQKRGRKKPGKGSGGCTKIGGGGA